MITDHFSLCRYHGTDRFSTYLQSRFNRRLFPFLGQISRTECEETIETSEVWKYVVFPWPFWVEDLGTRERTQEPIIVLSSQFDNVFGGFSYGNSDGPSLECDEYFTYFEHDGGIRSFDGWCLIVCVRFFYIMFIYHFRTKSTFVFQITTPYVPGVWFCTNKKSWFYKIFYRDWIVFTRILKIQILRFSWNTHSFSTQKKKDVFFILQKRPNLSLCCDSNIDPLFCFAILSLWFSFVFLYRIYCARV